MKYLFSILFVFSISLAFSQSNGPLITNESSGLTISEQWFGTIDGIHEIEMTLNRTDNSLEGFYILNSSMEKFELEGSIKNGDYHLQEIDHRLKISGNFILSKNQNKLDGTWSHQKETFSLKVELFTSKGNRSNICQQKNWRNIYSGLLDGSPIKIDLTKENNSAYKLDFEMDRIPITMIPECTDKNCKILRAESSQLKHLFEALEFRFSSNDVLNLIVLKDNGSKKIVKLNLIDELKYTCKNEADYSSRVDVIYPYLNNAFFNDFIQSILTEWNDHLEVEIKSLGGSDLGFFEEDRFKYASSTWADVSYFSDRFISGTLTLQKSWKGQNQRLSFIVDLKENKILEPIDFFNSEKAYNKVIVNFIKDQKRNYKPFQDQEISDWIKAEDFEFITLTKDGFVFNTSFNNIFGERNVSLSFSDIKKHLKKDFKKEFDIE